MNKAIIFALLIWMLPIHSFADGRTPGRKGVDSDGNFICHLHRSVPYQPAIKDYHNGYWTLKYLLILENRNTLEKFVKHSYIKNHFTKEDARKHDMIAYYQFKRKSEYYLQRGTCAWEEYSDSWVEVSKIIDNDEE